jgi:hypothetical protein
MTQTITAETLRLMGLAARDGDTGIRNEDGSVTITRASGAKATVEKVYGHWRTRVQPARPANSIAADHCQSCGSTAYEDLWLGDQGYTACCNERVVYGGCTTDDCSH